MSTSLPYCCANPYRYSWTLQPSLSGATFQLVGCLRSDWLVAITITVVWKGVCSVRGRHVLVQTGAACFVLGKSKPWNNLGRTVFHSGCWPHVLYHFSLSISLYLSLKCNDDLPPNLLATWWAFLLWLFLTPTPPFAPLYLSPPTATNTPGEGGDWYLVRHYMEKNLS